MHLFRRAHTGLLQVDADHFDTHPVAVEHGLHQRTDTRRNLVALFRQSCAHRHVAHHLAHCGFGGLHHCAGRVFALEQIGARIVQPVLHREFDLDDVLVGSQHRGFTQARGLDDVVAPHIHGADLGHEHQFMPLHGVWQAPVKAGTHGGFVAAKTCDDGLLAFLHDEKTGPQPDQQGDDRNQAQAISGILHVGLKTAPTTTRGTATAIAVAAEQSTQFAVEVTPQLIQVRWALVGTGITWTLRFRRLRGAVSARPGGRCRIGAVVRGTGIVIAAAPAGVVQIEHAPDAPWKCGPADCR